MARIHISDLEAAINHWRQRSTLAAGQALPPELDALATVYATLALAQADGIEDGALGPSAYAAWLAWYHTTPDTPCIAICSTAQGDAQCKGCGRSFEEVQHWLALSPAEKRVVWHRIRREGTAWRFSRYAERAAEVTGESLSN